MFISYPRFQVLCSLVARVVFFCITMVPFSLVARVVFIVCHQVSIILNDISWLPGFQGLFYSSAISCHFLGHTGGTAHSHREGKGAGRAINPNRVPNSNPLIFPEQS